MLEEVVPEAWHRIELYPNNGSKPTTLSHAVNAASRFTR
jgi:hypothetical protein